MRTLIFMRGLPGCGKSTFIKQQELENYTVSSDALRLMFNAPQLTPTCELKISQTDEKLVWNTLMAMVENRMKNGAFTVIDATNIKVADMNRYKNLADEYRYHAYCVDMTGISVEEAKKRNAKREELRRVPDEVIDRMAKDLRENKVPSWIKEIKPEEFYSVFLSPMDLSGYKKIHVIGDIHGCYDTLMRVLDGGIKDEEYYIFCGDYLDRGPDNAKVMNFLLSVYERKNIMLLEGNHEAHIRNWAKGLPARSETFNNVTAHELEDAGIDKKDARCLCRKFSQCECFRYYGRRFFVSHGGISNPAGHCLSFISSNQMIKGVGTYQESEMCDMTFARNGDLVQIHGHRNINKVPVKVNERCYNLEGGVEFGGELRSLVLSSEGISEHCEKNNELKIPERVDEEVATLINALNAETLNVETLIKVMRANPFIKEKKFGNISSFNFSRDAFCGGVWSSQTIKARGLFIDTQTNEIVARGYEKFFKVGERPETMIELLKESLSFPVRVYEKENGFLGMLSSYENKPLFATKSSIKGDYCRFFKRVFNECYSEETAKKIAEYSRVHNCTFVFEVIDTGNDPHIVEYSQNKAILLDVIDNDNKFAKLPYEMLVYVAQQFGIEVKRLAGEVSDYDAFLDFYSHVMSRPADKNDIEGYVVEDNNGFMCKIKTPFYSLWKYLRTVSEVVWRGGKSDTKTDNELEVRFREFVEKRRVEEPLNPVCPDIISLRKNFINSNI